ncbi:hypothetical protein [Aquipuribacter sp. MA13-6]|uniref:hypothetical protein n=1 Tax=unclassified Aquipuribacter TaxID=2635084 RepID=UPI003EEF00E2
MSDDWVARLLAEAERPTMPEDVAERLEQGLRRHLADAGPGPTAAPADEPTSAGDAPTAAGPTTGGVVEDGVPVTTASTGVAAEQPGTAPTEPPTAPSATAPSATAPSATEAAGGASPTGSSPTGSPPGESSPGPSSASPADRPASGSVPAPAVVPPAAGAGAGAAPLRAGTDGDAGRTPGSGPDEAAALSRTREGRTFGTPRREQRADDQGERRRRLLTRWVPVAAGVLVLGAAGAAAVNVLGGDSDTTADTAEEVAAADVADSVAPRSLVATGTEYTTADAPAFEQQVRDLVALTATGTEGTGAPVEEDSSAGAGAAAPAEPSAEALSSPARVDPSAARASAAANPLADAAALRECVETVTDGTDEDAAAVDLALVDGVESTLVVVPDPAGANLFVYVVGPDCTGLDSQFQFFTVAP